MPLYIGAYDAYNADAKCQWKGKTPPNTLMEYIRYEKTGNATIVDSIPGTPSNLFHAYFFL